MPRPEVLVLRAAGTNCDGETCQAFEMAGAKPVRLHMNRLMDNPARLSRFSILVIPGGFTYGDDIAAGRVLANEISIHLKDRIAEFLGRGRLILGICNGFQVLVKAGFLPGGGVQRATLTTNDSNRFECRWVRLRVETDKSPFVKAGETYVIPVAHAEGKFYAPDGVIDEVEKNGQVVFRYTSDGDGPPAYPDNPNGSINDIAGICDPTGQVLGLMPHPERNVLPEHHPRWTRGEPGGEGLRLFRNAVAHVKAL